MCWCLILCLLSPQIFALEPNVGNVWDRLESIFKVKSYRCVYYTWIAFSPELIVLTICSAPSLRKFSPTPPHRNCIPIMRARV
ncbi:hypothetical protein B0H19DRAFT_1199793 [Mycena capillaripes]|nr:hypothetical protein B0H19DRAFT_1199793 [Mycena capillaripes]